MTRTTPRKASSAKPARPSKSVLAADAPGAKLTPKQAAAKRAADAARAKAERQERMKKIFIVVVTVVLVLGLSLPTMALVVMGQMF